MINKQPILGEYLLCSVGVRLASSPEQDIFRLDNFYEVVALHENGQEISFDLIDHSGKPHKIGGALLKYFKSVLPELSSNTKIISKYIDTSTRNIVNFVNKLKLDDYLLCVEHGSAIFKVPVEHYETVKQLLEEEPKQWV